MDLINSYCMYPVFEEPTRFQNNTKTAIDYVLTNFNAGLLAKYVMNTGLSDHTCQKIAFEVNKPQENNFHTFRSFSHRNILKFKHFLTSESWRNVLSAKTVENKYHEFNN